MSTDARAEVLQAVDQDIDAMLGFLADLVRVPSISGSDDENTAQAHLATALEDDGLDVDYWQIPLPELVAGEDFPGMEVARDEAWGLVGRLPGNVDGDGDGDGDGPTLMLNGHIDVVPPGDQAAWSSADPFSGRVDGGVLYGRGACDMKAGLVAARWAARALRRSSVPLRGDVLLASVQGEEDGGLGTYATLHRGWRADACVIPEPTGLDLVPASAGP